MKWFTTSLTHCIYFWESLNHFHLPYNFLPKRHLFFFVSIFLVSVVLCKPVPWIVIRIRIVDCDFVNSQLGLTEDVWHQKYGNKKVGFQRYLKYQFNSILISSLIRGTRPWICIWPKSGSTQPCCIWRKKTYILYFSWADSGAGSGPPRHCLPLSSSPDRTVRTATTSHICF